MKSVRSYGCILSISYWCVCAVHGTHQAFGRLIAARTVACDMTALLYLSILCVADTFDTCSVCPGRNLNHSSIVSYWSVWQTSQMYAVCHFIQHNHDHWNLSRLTLPRILAFPTPHLTMVYVCLVISLHNLYIWNVLSGGIWRHVCQWL